MNKYLKSQFLNFPVRKGNLFILKYNQQFLLSAESITFGKKTYTTIIHNLGKKIPSYSYFIRGNQRLPM